MAQKIIPAHDRTNLKKMTPILIAPHFRRNRDTMAPNVSHPQQNESRSDDNLKPRAKARGHKNGTNESRSDGTKRISLATERIAKR